MAPDSPNVQKPSQKRGRQLLSSQDPSFTWADTLYKGKADAWVRLGRNYVEVGGDGTRGFSQRILMFSAFLRYYVALHEFWEPADILVHPPGQGPRVYPPLIGEYQTAPFRNSKAGSVQIGRLCKFLEWVIDREYSDTDEYGRRARPPGVYVPFDPPVYGKKRRAKSDKGVLPFGYIEELRKLLMSGPNFRDMIWAQGAIGSQSGGSKSGDWFESQDPEAIRRSALPQDHPDFDPDLVWRKREVPVYKTYPNGRYRDVGRREVFELWSPVRALAVVVKLLVPLRTYQVRMLDSGECDVERVDFANPKDAYTDVPLRLKWSDNSLRRDQLLAGLDDESKTLSLPWWGAFQRFTRSFTSEPLTGLFVNTNKTADISKNASDRGYLVPWQFDELLRILLKLRNWQERYNPIQRPIRWTQLETRHLGHVKSQKELSALPPTCFLFRDPTDRGNTLELTEITPERREQRRNHRFHPITDDALVRLWSLALLHFEERLRIQGVTGADGQPVRLVRKTTRDDSESKSYSWITTYYPLHSLRVSLLTSLAFDGKVSLPTLMDLAGHSRIVMTIYYLKKGAKATHEELRAGRQQAISESEHNLRKWLRECNFRELAQRVVFADDFSAQSLFSDGTATPNPNLFLRVADGWCLASGNTVPGRPSQPGCYNGGAIIRGSQNSHFDTHAPVTPRCCAENHCRWLMTGPAFLDSLRAKFNAKSCKISSLAKRLNALKQQLQDLAAAKYDAECADRPFDRHEYDQVQSLTERTESDLSTQQIHTSNLLHLIERCLRALPPSDATSSQHQIVALGTRQDVEVALGLCDSEFAQLNAICEDLLTYPELEPENADVILRRSQLIDRTLYSQLGKTLLLAFDTATQLRIGNELIKEMQTRLELEQNSAGRVPSEFELVHLTSELIEKLQANSRSKQVLEGALAGLLNQSKKPILATSI